MLIYCLLVTILIWIDFFSQWQLKKMAFKLSFALVNLVKTVRTKYEQRSIQNDLLCNRKPWKCQLNLMLQISCETYQVNFFFARSKQSGFTGFFLFQSIWICNILELFLFSKDDFFDVFLIICLIFFCHLKPKSLDCHSTLFKEKKIFFTIFKL